VVLAGLVTNTVSDTMVSKNKKTNKNVKFKKMVRILKFINTIDDLVVIQSSIEAIIEMLEEEITP
jgi:hypothetical protein